MQVIGRKPSICLDIYLGLYRGAGYWENGNPNSYVKEARNEIVQYILGLSEEFDANIFFDAVDAKLNDFVFSIMENRNFYYSAVNPHR